MEDVKRGKAMVEDKCKLYLLGVGKSVIWVTIRRLEIGWAQGGRNKPITNRSKKKRVE